MLTEFILQDLKARLLAQENLPARLTLPALAAHYRVSLTPVRLAVNALLAENLLRKQANGRLEIVPQPGILSKRRLSVPPTLPPRSPQEWEAMLARELLLRSLRGSDEYMREEAMAQRFGVGRTVVRQVFSRLAGKGVLVHHPHRGWQVRTYDEADMRAYLVTREALELTALDLARPYLIAADLERMRQGNVPADGTESPRLDNELHRYLIEKADNVYLRDFFDRNGLYYTLLFDYAAPEASVLNEMAAQHREILTALLEEDWNAARAALSQHIRAQHPIVKGLMERAAAQRDSHAPEEEQR